MSKYAYSSEFLLTQISAFPVCVWLLLEGKASVDYIRKSAHAEIKVFKIPCSFQITSVSFPSFPKHAFIWLSIPEWDVSHPLQRSCGVLTEQGAFKQVLD